MKVLVCGGRRYHVHVHVFTVLDEIHAATPITCIVTGACHSGGADLWAEQWAKAREVAYRGYPAKWHTHGEWCRCHPQRAMVESGMPPHLALPAICTAAGPWRNQRMLKMEHRPEPNPDCEDCHGGGEFMGHAAGCDDHLCALAGGYDDCAGRMVKCDCLDPKAPVIGLVVAFPGNRGTASMVEMARAAGIEVWEPGK